MEQPEKLTYRGEDQQKLDIFANDVFKSALSNREIVCGMTSEEEDDFITIFSINNGHYTHFSQGAKDYLKYCQAEEDDCTYAYRYIDSMGIRFSLKYD